MANITELFSKFISEGAKAAQLITDSKEKAIAYASLASACAQSGMVSPAATLPSTEDVVAAYAEPKSEKQPETKAEVKEEAKQEAEPTKTSTADDAPSAEWTEESLERFSSELQFINEKAEEFGAETINAALAQFSDGNFDSYENDVSPLNIVGFTAYMRELMEAA